MYASCKRNLKSKNFCFLDLNLACFGGRGPPWKIFKEKIWTCQNKSCSTIISEQLCQKTKNSHLLSFRDKGGHNFQRKYTNFGIFGPKVAPGRSENLINGLGTPKYPYFDPWPASLGPLGEKQVSPPPFRVTFGAFLTTPPAKKSLSGSNWAHPPKNWSETFGG